jgi:hypothetical protein
MDHITRQPCIISQHRKMFELLKLIAVFGTDEYARQAFQLVQEINQENKQ